MGKFQNVNFVEKIKVPTSGMELNPVFKEINRLRLGIKGVVTSRARSHPAKFPICEKELKKSFQLGVVGHTFNPSTGKAEAGGSLSLRLA